MNEFMKWLAVALCACILAGQLWRAKRTNSRNTLRRYHWLAGLLTLAVSGEMAVLMTNLDGVYWTEVLVLGYVLVTQVLTVPEWVHGVPDKYKTCATEEEGNYL